MAERVNIGANVPRKKKLERSANLPAPRLKIVSYFDGYSQKKDVIDLEQQRLPL